jgi:diguanylate cyclase (GGDEF)-like protein
MRLARFGSAGLQWCGAYSRYPRSCPPAPAVTIHIPTLLLALVLGFALLGLTLAVARRDTADATALRLWERGVWAFLAGFVLFGLRPWIAQWVSVLLGNALLSLGGTLFAASLYRFLLNRALPAWTWAWCAVSVAAVALMLDWPLAQRTIVLSFVFAGVLAPSILLIARHGRNAERSLRIVAATLVLASLALLGRGVHALLDPDNYQDLLQPSLGQGLTFLAAFVGLLGAGFGFLLCCLERTARRMELLATHDSLTGCLNRASVEALLEHTLQRSRRDGSPTALALLDIDHFKQVNDRFGHRSGDAVLKAFTQTVRSRLRGSDVLGRVGGEEFLLVLPATDAAGALRACENVRAAVAALRVPAGNAEIAVTVSGGVVVAPSDSALEAERLIASADEALYRGKAAGRNRIVLA